MRYLLAVVALSTVVAGQTAPQFDVVSIKKSAALDNNGGGGPLPGGRFKGTNMATLGLVTLAFGIPADRVVNAADWLRTDRFDIDARSTATTEPSDMQVMLRGLLTERFALQAHTEMREVPVYALVESRSDKKFGPRMSMSTINCDDPDVRRTAGTLPNGVPACGLQAGQGHLGVGGMTLARLAQALASPAGRPVVNRTTTPGAFNFELDWAPTPGKADDERVPIFTAVQEQLGLKLQSDTAPMEVVVIDRIERPSEN